MSIAEFPLARNADPIAERLRARLENDIGNAERFVERHGDEVMYVPGLGWYVWDGRRWVLDTADAAIKRMAQTTAKAIFRESEYLGDPDAATRRSKWAANSGKSSRLDAMLKEARPHLIRKQDELDTDPNLLNVKNGTIDLRTGDLRPHDRADLITKLAPVNYRGPRDSVHWSAFLDRVVPDPEVQEFLQRFLGYGITGLTVEQALLFLIGGGANGKTTFLEAIRNVLGDYCVTLPFGALLHTDGRGGGATPDIAKLVGTRLVFASEPEVGQRFSEGIIKHLTGSDTITARNLYKGPIEFKPAFSLIIAGNNRPTIRGTDEAIWRRFYLVPFEEFIPPEERDRDLPAKLNREMSAILGWIVEGAQLWFESGLKAPEVVQAATTSYRQENDAVSQFIDEMTTTEDGAWLANKELRAAYDEWCKENGYHPLGGKLFGQRLEGMGYPARKYRGIRGRSGLRLFQ
ncbi:MAG: phage/plasmid primase, P4 family [Proteobacteria bacterium]|nr:phage/plasmid primase, P4 family [Pseudomonadota bacterium]